MALLISILIFNFSIGIILYESQVPYMTNKADKTFFFIVSFCPIMNLNFLLDDINEDLEVLSAFGKEGIDYGNKIN